MHYIWLFVPATFHCPHSDKHFLLDRQHSKTPKKYRRDSFSFSPTHSSSLQELCGTAALCRKSSLGAVATVLGSEPTTLPLCWPRFSLGLLPLIPCPVCLRVILVGRREYAGSKTSTGLAELLLGRGYGRNRWKYTEPSTKHNGLR